MGNREFLLNGFHRVGDVVWPWLYETSAFTACEVVEVNGHVDGRPGGTHVIVKPLVSLIH